MRPNVGQAYKRETVYATGCGFDSHSGKQIFNILISRFRFRSGVKAKRGVEFHHSTRNAHRIAYPTKC